MAAIAAIADAAGRRAKGAWRAGGTAAERRSTGRVPWLGGDTATGADSDDGNGRTHADDVADGGSGAHPTTTHAHPAHDLF